jgi:predicted N-formylglutamate amidohydrolase
MSMPPAPIIALLGAADPAAVELCNPGGSAPVLLTCDHASRAVPQALGSLGLDEASLARHIGWDIGAAEVTRRLAALLDAPALLSGYSRLVIDCNREPADVSSIPAASDGVTVPGNIGLSAAARAARRAAIFEPYHAAISAWIEAALARSVVPAYLSIHSFTPEMDGRKRPWHVGILWDHDKRIPEPLLTELAADTALVVGDNEPYSAREPPGFSLHHHAVARGLPHVEIELRQDLIADSAGMGQWADRLAHALRPILACRDIYRLEP